MEENKYHELTPGEAIRKFCVACVGSSAEVHNCKGDKLVDGTVCNFFKYRLGKGRPSVKSIRRECVKCMGGSSELIKDCVSQTCPVHKYRFGKNPNMPKGGGRAGQFVKKTGAGADGNV